MQKIAIGCSKGGVGKTTTACHLAYGLAHGGYKTLLVDTDSQGHCSRLLGVQAERGLAELLTGGDPSADPIEARPNLRLLAGGSRISAATRAITQQDVSQFALSEALEPVADGYDYVILDTSPSWDALSVNVAFYVDCIMSPVSTELLSVDGFTSYRQRLEAISKYRPVPIRWVVPTVLDRRVRRSGTVAAALADSFGDALCAPIRYSSRMAELAAYGQMIWEYAPTDRGAVDYAKLVRRVIDDG